MQDDGSRPGESGATEDVDSEAGSETPWDRSDLTDNEWLKVLKALEKRKTRLEPPPRDNPRDREAYLVLRSLLMQDAAARKAFLAIRWKGKPNGLALLCQLLSRGTWVPDVETDGDYLEAELEHLDPDHAERGARDGEWSIGHGWTVTREIRTGNVRAYTARATSAD